MNTFTYKSTNFYLTAFLIAKGNQIIGIESIDNKRSQFILVSSPELQDQIDQYNFAQTDSLSVNIDARKLIAAIKLLKDKLYSNE